MHPFHLVLQHLCSHACPQSFPTPFRPSAFDIINQYPSILAAAIAPPSTAMQSPEDIHLVRARMSPDHLCHAFNSSLAFIKQGSIHIHSDTGFRRLDAPRSGLAPCSTDPVGICGAFGVHLAPSSYLL
ncbi:hypothetical protein EVG20_g232 [Dentipellis fragilis]|uniref:Uncharacterized protein n=1 Tax=Dentipellis fragilis TaxID=205917 RepID=A0A4Y9ZDF2_9AGAM|nr:hypothetical protein EVG20_g232 [Dentipellis fragilis]